MARSILIHARNPGAYTGAGNNTYLLPGPSPTLIDAGPGTPHHLDAVQHHLAGVALSRVLVTHAHPDHVGGAVDIARRWPAAALAKIPWPEEDVGSGIFWETLGDGDLISAGEGQLRVLHTPGHSPDHACFLDEDDSTLYTGDLLVGGGTVVIPASQGGSLLDYLASLRRIVELDPAVALPAHGSRIDRPADLARQYIDHRLLREREILDALHQGQTTPARIVTVVYPELQPALFDAAAESVLAHLRKLEGEQRVRQVGDEWHLDQS